MRHIHVAPNCLRRAIEISYLGHSCFRIRGRDAAMVTDPFSPKYGYTMGRPNADIVTVSHGYGADHVDHTCVDGVAGEFRVVKGPGEYEISNVLVNGVRTYGKNGNGDLHLNTVYVADVDDLRVCHLGELDDLLSAEQVESIGSINVLMIPVGGQTTIGANLAAQVVSQLEPNIVIPMHYRIEGTRWEQLEPVDKFVREMGSKALEPQPKLSLSGKGLPADIQVTILDHKKSG